MTKPRQFSLRTLLWAFVGVAFLWGILMMRGIAPIILLSLAIVVVGVWLRWTRKIED